MVDGNRASAYDCASSPCNAQEGRTLGWESRNAKSQAFQEQPAFEECLRRFDWKPWNVRSAELESNEALALLDLILLSSPSPCSVRAALFQGSCHSNIKGCVASGGAYIIRVELQIKRDGRIGLMNSC